MFYLNPYFISYLTTQRSAFGQWRGDSPSHMMLKMKQICFKIGFSYTYVTWAGHNYDWNILRMKAYY